MWIKVDRHQIKIYSKILIKRWMTSTLTELYLNYCGLIFTFKLNHNKYMTVFQIKSGGYGLQHTYIKKFVDCEDTVENLIMQSVKNDIGR